MSNKNQKSTPKTPGPMGGMGGNVEKAKNFKKTFRSLLKYLSKYYIQLLIVFVFAIASTVFQIVGPKILGNATTEIFNGLVGKISGGSGINFDKIKDILIFMVILYVISAIFSYIQGLLMTNVSQKVTYNLRKEISEKINKLPINYFDKKNNGEILSIITNDIDTLSQSLNQSLSQIVTSVFTIIGILIMMLTISIEMTFVTLLILPISFIIIGVIMMKSQKYFKQQQDYLANINGYIEETYSGHNIVKVFNKEKDFKKEFSDKNDLLYNTSWKSQFLSGMMMPIMGFIGNIGYVLVAIAGGYYTVKGKITVGNIQSFIQYSRQFTQPISQIAQISNVLQSMVASYERIYEFLNEEEEISVVSDNTNVDTLNTNVTFENVEFGYNKEKIVIKDFSATVKNGQKIAIVGPTGAGKTTLVNLLMRFYEINSGKIFIDGHDIKNFDKNEIRKMFGMVLQDTWSFNGTIMENIRYGNLNATDEEVIEAAKEARVHHFVQTLEDGYNTILNEEASNISQGQKQLITIARAILAKPKILILDEATSSVDTRTEILIQEAMDNFMENKTSFIIAHRLSTIKNADVILVINDGDIIEQGNHEELMLKNGFYTNLYNSQFKKDI